MFQRDLGKKKSFRVENEAFRKIDVLRGLKINILK